MTSKPTHTNLYVLTGAPGTGKTAVLRHLATDVPWVAEPAREVLADERAKGGDATPEKNPRRFVDLLLQSSIAKYEAASGTHHSVLFDRGVPDCIAYAETFGIDAEACLDAAAIYRYNGQVMVMTPWEQIYTTDDERKMAFSSTIEFQRRIEGAYRRLGYSLVEVPRGSVEERAAFVKSVISS